MVALAGREKPSAAILLEADSVCLPTGSGDRDSMDGVRWLGTGIQVTVFTGDAPAIAAILTSAARVTDLIAGDLVTLDEHTAELRILQGTSNVTSRVAHRLVYSLNSFDTFLVYWTAPNGVASDVEIIVPNATTPMVRDPRTGASEAPTHLQKGTRNHVRMPSVADHPRSSTSAATAASAPAWMRKSAAACRRDHLSPSAGAGRAGRRPADHTPTSASNSTSIPRLPIRRTCDRESPLLGPRRRRVGRLVSSCRAK
jgi:hypothetical protein